MYFKLSKFNRFVVINCLFGIYYFRIHKQLVILAYFCVEQNSIFVFISSCKKVINFLSCHFTKNSGKFCCWFLFIVFAHNENFLFLPLFREFIFWNVYISKNRPIFCRLVTILYQEVPKFSLNLFIIGKNRSNLVYPLNISQPIHTT